MYYTTKTRVFRDNTSKDMLLRILFSDSFSSLDPEGISYEVQQQQQRTNKLFIAIL